MYREAIENLKTWKAKKNRKPLIVKGARQIGKTYLLKKFGKEEFAEAHYLNFEEKKELIKYFEGNLTPDHIIDKLSIYLEKKIDVKKDILIFDEVQYCPNALTSLKYFNENLPGLAICAAGSLLGLELNPESLSFPVGKVDFLNMFPMSFFEFLSAMSDKKSLEKIDNFEKDFPESLHEHLWKQMKLYFIVGGLPEIVKIFVEHHAGIEYALSLVREKQKILINAYLADIAKHCGNINAMHIERLWHNIPAQLAREQNAAAPKFKLRGQIPGIKGYERIAGALDWLLKAGLVIKVKIVNSGQVPLSAYTEENRFKLFMFDVGILGALSDLDAKSILKYDYGTYKGYFAENFVAQTIAYTSRTSENIYSWKENTSEVEFLKALDGGTIIPIEVKSGFVTHSKSSAVFQEKYKSPYRIILSGKNLYFDKKRSTKYYPLYMVSKIMKQ